MKLQQLRDRRRIVLIVDDEPLLLGSIRRTLKRMGIDAETAESGPAALQLLEGGLTPDVLLTDQRMPGMTGAHLMQIVHDQFPGVVRVCMSGQADRPEILRAINDGHVYRFLQKPWDLDAFEETLFAAIGHADLMRENEALHEMITAQNRQLLELNAELGHGLEQRTLALIQTSERLDAALMETVRALANTIEAKDRYTAGHSELVSLFAVELARKVGLTRDDFACLRLGGTLHDVGKIAVPDSVLLKPGKLTDEEYDQVKSHPVVGYRILKDIAFPYDVLPIVRSHHERWDGRGYPDRTAKEDTPLLARITHVVDVFEAITARRVYRKPMPLDRVIQIFEKGKGTDFDPELVEPFLELLHGGVFDQIRKDAGMDVVQEIGEFTFKEKPKVELRED
jgi:putative nucleotidyltransferase with HDIG domain